MIISPPFLPDIDVDARAAGSTDPMMDAIDRFELTHEGIFPIAQDRRWHCGVHLAPAYQTEPVRAIADGEVLAYAVSQRAIPSGKLDVDGKKALNTNTGFVLLKHTTETGEGRTITFYSLYMHLLDLDNTRRKIRPIQTPPEIGSSTQLPKWLAEPTDGVQVPANRKVYRKDMLGYPGMCDGSRHLHFEIFMAEDDFDAYFSRTSLDDSAPQTPSGSDWWGHAYFMVPAGCDFSSVPPAAAPDNRLNGVLFLPGQAGRNALPLHVEMYFDKGTKFTNVWSVAADGVRTLLTPQPFAEKDYEYDLYQRATALYPACPSEGYELFAWRGAQVLVLPSASVSTALSEVRLDQRYGDGTDNSIPIVDFSVWNYKRAVEK